MQWLKIIYKSFFMEGGTCNGKSALGLHVVLQVPCVSPHWAMSARKAEVTTVYPGLPSKGLRHSRCCIIAERMKIQSLLGPQGPAWLTHYRRCLIDGWMDRGKGQRAGREDTRTRDQVGGQQRHLVA